MMAGSPVEIPLVPQSQRLTVQLVGTFYQLGVAWNPRAEVWVLTISDSDGVAVVGGIPLVTGCDLLAQYAYLGIEGQLIVESADEVDAVPTYANLGTNGRLFFVPNE